MKPKRPAWLLLVIIGLLLIPAPKATAATPAFGFDIVVDGSTVQVVVEFEPVPAGFAWPQLEASGVLDQLVGIYPSDQIDDHGRPLPDAVPRLLSLERIEEGVYADSIVLPEGRWAVVAWPLIPDFDPDSNPGAAGTEVVTVGGLPALVYLGLGALAAIALVSFALRPKTSRDQAATTALPERQ